MAFRASCLLLIFCTFSIVSCLSIYLTSYLLGHVNPVLPYINYVGDKPPESTFYTQIVVIIGCMLMLIVQIRFVQVFHYFKMSGITNLYNCMNTVSVFVGYIASFGLVLAACFQETHAFLVHHIGGMVLFFVGGSIYITLQSAVSYRMIPLNDSASSAYLRMVLTVLVLISLVGYITGYIYANKEFKKPWEYRFYWEKDDGGWRYYITSTTCQWVLIFLFNAYICTYSKDFNEIWLRKRRISVIVPHGSQAAAVS